MFVIRFIWTVLLSIGLGFVFSLQALPTDTADDGFFIGDDQFAQDQIDVLSAANRLLFIDDNLRSVKEPLTLYYDFLHQSIYDDDYKGRVLVKVNRIRDNGRKDLSFRYLSGRHRLRFQARPDMKTNPVFMLFLESDVREMRRITGGSSLFFRSRIRQALATAETQPYRFRHNGKELEGHRIILQPYNDLAEEEDKIASRLRQFRYKTYEFVLSDAIMGGIYRLRSSVPLPAEGEDAKTEGKQTETLRIDDVLLYRGFEPHASKGMVLP